MLAAGFGRILNITSQQQSRAFNHSGIYGASKGGLAALTRSMAEAWSAAGVTTNAIAPGLVATPMTAAVLADPARAKALAARTMVGRNGVPDDLTGAALFLASEAAAYITGQTLFVDGGFSVT
jgi:gluconate 5-dehydrogenase